MSALVIAEHNNTALNSATLNTIAAAFKIGSSIDVLVAGHNCRSVAEQLGKTAGIAKVILVDHEAYAHHLAENLATLAARIGKGYSHILAPASFFGKNVMPRIAALLDAVQISDVTAIESADTFVRPIYAGNALATVQTTSSPVMLTVRPTAFDPASAEGGSAVIESAEGSGETGLTRFVGQELTKSERPDLQTARIVISGGRGLANGENFHKYIEPVADKLGAAIGASRAAVDAGFVPNDYQVGQTGKIVAPQLYIAVGISGAIQHLAGMKDSKVIVAINKDAEAPIFQIADYGLVADLFEALPAMEKALA
ncbi:MAG: FAD-binding protein [Micavibrio aeruginosavorus]|uniref:Electron transfer flavoprotein subunit alpha n=1 Tax=Micavibrio aeruginosavorus TaxID=349221 RepID=A0A7T5UFT5_9BACT|nr:MAG: FAD-binding protein [Micavibrio aeruginosavorus]